MYTLVTSGLRAAELVQLHWKDLELLEGLWTARFIGKGGKEAEQELYSEAVEACRRYFREQFHRDPRPEDALFWTMPSYNGDKPRPLPYNTLWRRVREIGQAVRKVGVITRSLPFSPHLFRRTYGYVLVQERNGNLFY